MNVQMKLPFPAAGDQRMTVDEITRSLRRSSQDRTPWVVYPDEAGTLVEYLDRMSSELTHVMSLLRRVDAGSHEDPAG